MNLQDLGLSEQRVGQPTVNLRDLGLSDLRVGQLDELVNRLLPSLSSEEGPAASRWRTSHVSADSFFQNKHGEDRVVLFDQSVFLLQGVYL